MDKVKVIEFITSLGEGGAQSLVKDYAIMLDKERFEVSIFCIFPILESGPGQLVKKANIDVISVYPKYNKFYGLINKCFGAYIVPRKLKSYLVRKKIDCMHAHLAVLKYLPKIKDVLPKKLIYTCHSEPLKNFKSKDSIEFKSALSLIKSNNLQMVALHQQMREQLNDLFSVNNSVVVYNGINVERFQSVPESKNDIRNSLGLKDDDFVIGHVGRFTYPKNHVFIIDVFNQVVKHNTKAKLLLVGTGELKAIIKKQVSNLRLSDNVLFLDQRSDIERILKAMDVFLFPSHYEGLPVSLIEAQAAGLKCVTSTNVTEESFLTSSLYPLRLEAPIEEWVNTILSDTIEKSPYNKDIKTFEMKEDIKVLESLYCS